MEDVDWAVGKRDDEHAGSADPQVAARYQGLARVTFSGLLNALDGVVATEERLIFMTTNRIDLLPPVMIRPGRIDIQAHIGAATKLQAKRMFIRFFPESEDAEAQKFADIVITKNIPISMADLQGFFLFFKHDKNSLMVQAPSFLQGMAGTTPHNVERIISQQAPQEESPETKKRFQAAY